jgi:uncharacterized protein YndB with AHSA1/START domain
MTSNQFEIRETASFDLPIENVWDALVVQNGLKRWLNAQLFVLEIDDCGLIEIPFERGGTAVDILGETSFINPNQRLMFTWIERNKLGREWTFPTVVSLEFEPQASGTLMTLSHKGFKWLPLETREEILTQYKHYWHEKMGESLREVVLSGVETGERIV